MTHRDTFTFTFSVRNMTTAAPVKYQKYKLPLPVQTLEHITDVCVCVCVCLCVRWEDAQNNEPVRHQGSGRKEALPFCKSSDQCVDGIRSVLNFLL